MKKKDLYELQTVCAVYSLCYSLNELLDDCESDLPECIHADIFRHYLSTFLGDMETYRDETCDMFISACGNAEGEP